MHHRNSRGALATTLSTHRIRTAQVAQRIVASTGLAPPVLVVEVGAGDGILTHELAARGLRVVAIERDRDAYCSLRDRFGASPLVTPVMADFLTCDLPHASPYVVFGNPPFSITSPILRRVLAASHAPDAIFLVLQREAAFGGGRRHAERRAAARPWRQVHLPRAQDGVLLARLHQGHGHDDRPRMTAPVHRHRS